MGTYHEGITLSGEDLDRVNGQCLRVDAIDFDYGHGMVIDVENVVRVAGDGDQTETVARTQSIQYTQYSIVMSSRNLRWRERLRLWLRTVFRLGR